MIAAFMAVCAGILLQNKIIIGVAAVLVAFIFLVITKRIFIFIILTSLLTVVSDISADLRTYIQLIAFSSMLLIFIKDYGFEFRNYKKVPLQIIYLVIFLFFAMFTAAFFSDHPGASVLYIIRTALFLVLCYIIYSQIRTEKEIFTLLLVLVGSGLVLTGSVISDFVASGGQLLSLLTSTYTRSSGLISSVNNTGGLIANLIPIFLGFIFYSKFNGWKRISLISVLGFLLIGVLLTISRASYISIFISIGVVIFGLKKAVLKWFALTLFIGFLVYLTYKPFYDLITLLFRVEDGLSGREFFWDVAINIIRENFWFGIGPGTYGMKVFNYLPVSLDSYWGQNISELMVTVKGANSSHNMYLVYFSDMGILGFIAAILIPVVFYYIAVKLIKLYKKQSELKYVITIAITAMGSGNFIRSLFLEMGVLHYGYITTDLPFWLGLGILSHFYITDLEPKNSATVIEGNLLK